MKTVAKLRYILIVALVSILFRCFFVKNLRCFRFTESAIGRGLGVFRNMVTNSKVGYEKELEIASLAVKRASLLARTLSDIRQTRDSGTQIKEDKSPVTVGDYAIQAIIIHAIKKNFPDDNIVGEEDSSSLRSDGNSEALLKSEILKAITDVQEKTETYNDKLGKLEDLNIILDSIDLGNSEGGRRGRFWCLDPIDGTKGFLRGDQFAVCLALIEDGNVVLGIIGCPNLPAVITSNENKSGEKGGLYTAVKNAGSFYSSLYGKDFVPLTQQRRIEMSTHLSPDNLKVLEGVEKGHSSHSTQAQIKKALGFDEKTVSMQTINLDSQVKYCVLAKGQGDIYLRLPVSDTYREKIWDHAAGSLLVKESGGKVGDMYGNELDFGNGRYLQSKGVIASNEVIFEKVIDAVSQVT